MKLNQISVNLMLTIDQISHLTRVRNSTLFGMADRDLVSGFTMGCAVFIDRGLT